jgi:uncharacterized membrane protein
LPDTDPNPAAASKPRRWTIVAAGLLLFALALVVIYTSRTAFFSPLAMVVVAAIGLAALLLQLRLRRDISVPVRTPLVLNGLGLVFAIAALLADVLRVNTRIMVMIALGAVLCFAVSGVIVLRALRKQQG